MYDSGPQTLNPKHHTLRLFARRKTESEQARLQPCGGGARWVALCQQPIAWPFLTMFLGFRVHPDEGVENDKNDSRNGGRG